MNPEISVVIPLYNEERCLGANAAEVKAFLDARDSSWELILVNDGSRDRTLAIAARLAREDPRIRLISYGKNRGKGYAVRTGMLEARGRYRVFMDADLAVPVEYAGTCHDRLIQGAEVVIGSRHLPGACIQVPEEPLRQALGGIYRKMILAGFRLAVTDITCGLKGFSAEATVAIFSRSVIERWGYDAELLFLAQKLGYRVEEIPVQWFHSFDSAVHVVKDSIRSFAEMIEIYWRYARGRYRLPSMGGMEGSLPPK